MKSNLHTPGVVRHRLRAGIALIPAIVLAGSLQADTLDIVSLPADADAFLRSGAANTNEGGNPLLRIQAGGSNRAIVWFDQQKINEQVPAGDLLIKAELKVTTADNANNWGKNGDRTIGVHRLLEAWAEGDGINSEVPSRFRNRGAGPGVTWNMAIDAEIANGKQDPGVPWVMAKKGPNPWVPEPSGQSNILNSIGADSIFTWDVTTDVIGFLQGGDNMGWIIKKDDESKAGKILFCSREYDDFIAVNPDQATTTTQDDHRPQLILTVLRQDDAPLPPLVFTSNADTYLRSGASNTNEGGNPYMRLQASGNNRALISFNLGQAPPQVSKATLYVTIAENAENWGNNLPRTVSAHRLLTGWTEGNGTNSEVPHWAQFRGSGPGATWSCPTDTNVANQVADPLGGLLWKGGNGKTSGDPPFYAPATAPGAGHDNTMGVGTVLAFDVTQDVLDGAEFGWLIKKDNESQSGKVTYYTREGALAEGNPLLQPTLVLEY
jgi:hypothetical protein